MVQSQKSVLNKLGIRPIINAWGTVTALGGNVLNETTVEGYRELSKVFVDMREYTEAANEYVSKLLGVESSMIVPGAAAGIVIAVASLISEGDLVKAAKMPFTEGFKNEIIILRSHESPYKYLAQIPGAHIIDIGSSNGITEEDLRSTINDKTAGLLFFDYTPLKTGLTLVEICKFIHQFNIPIVVDAAAELPPITNFTKYIKQGADLVIFSGGKDIAGPNNTGIIIGRKQFVMNCKSIGPLIYKEIGKITRVFIGRPMKITKEDIAAFILALENYIKINHPKRMEKLEKRVQVMITKLIAHNKNLKVRITKEEPGDIVRPLTIPKLAINVASIGLDAKNIVEQLKLYDPPIYCYYIRNEVIINPQCIRPDEDTVIIGALIRFLK